MEDTTIIQGADDTQNSMKKQKIFRKNKNYSLAKT